MASTSLIDEAIPCRQCGYDLRGTPLGSYCPECGTRVANLYQGMRVDGNYLVIRSGAVLPNRCVKTNEPVDRRPWQKTLYYVNPFAYLLLILNILIGAIAILIIRKKCEVTFYVGSEYRSQRFKRLLIAWMVLFISIGCIVAAIAEESGMLGWLGAGLFLLSCVLFIVFTTTLSVRKARDGDFWVKGCCPEFLADVRATSSMGSAFFPAR